MIPSINTFYTMSSILHREGSKLSLTLPTDLENLTLSNASTKFTWAAENLDLWEFWLMVSHHSYLRQRINNYKTIRNVKNHYPFMK